MLVVGVVTEYQEKKRFYDDKLTALLEAFQVSPLACGCLLLIVYRRRSIRLMDARQQAIQQYVAYDASNKDHPGINRDCKFSCVFFSFGFFFARVRDPPLRGLKQGTIDRGVESG